MKYINIFFIIVFTVLVQAEEMPKPNSKKALVILTSTPDYSKAKNKATELSKNLDLKLDLRGLLFHQKSGLTFDKKACLDGPLQKFPCYEPRGKYNDGAYVSIEYSNSYKEFKKGLFIVVAFSGSPSEATAELNKIKPHIKDAYLKSIYVHMAAE